jgi:hypothetical protein
MPRSSSLSSTLSTICLTCAKRVKPCRELTEKERIGGILEELALKLRSQHERVKESNAEALHIKDDLDNYFDEVVKEPWNGKVVDFKRPRSATDTLYEKSSLPDIRPYSARTEQASGKEVSKEPGARTKRTTGILQSILGRTRKNALVVVHPIE